MLKSQNNNFMMLLLCGALNRILKYAPLKMYTYIHQSETFTDLNPKNKAIRIMEGLLYLHVKLHF